MAASTKRGSTKRRVGSYVIIALACVLLFLIPSSYVAARGGPTWLAAVIGALAFPVIPGLWHGLAEWRRRKRVAAIAAASKVPLKPGASASSLSGRDRLTLRMIAVALVAIAPLVVFDRGRVWAGLRHHATWFIPTDPGFDGGYATTFVRQVPADAEEVVVMRDHPRRLIDRSYTQHGGMVSARRGADAMVVVPKNAATEDATLLPGLIGYQVSAVAPILRDDVVIATTGTWGQLGTGPSAAMMAQLARAPADATAVYGMVPRDPLQRGGIRAGVAWLTRTSTGLRAGARFEVAAPATADELATKLRALITVATLASKCPEPLGRAVAGLTFEPAGSVLIVRAELPDALVGELAACVMPKPTAAP